MLHLAGSNLGPAEVSTTSKYHGPNPSEKGTDWLLWGALAAGGFLLFGGSTSSATATTSGAATVSGSSTGSPALATPGAPIELQQVGGTATSVTVECAMEATATLYSWYSYGSSNLLATSPTNVAVIDGLQTNTGYYVYVVASNASGSSAPSQPLLVTTGAGSPIFIYNENAPPTSTGSATTSAPTLAVSVATSASTATVGASVTATATLSGGPSNTSPTVLGGQTAGPVSWAVTIAGPTGTATGSGAGYSVATDTFTLDASGSYTVTAVAAYAGATATGAATVTAEPQQTSGGGGGGGGAGQSPLSLSVSASPGVFVEPGTVSIAATLDGGPSGPTAAIDGGSSGPVSWAITLAGGNIVRTGRGSGYSAAAWTPTIDQYGTYTVTATASYGGQTVSASTNFTAEQPSQATGNVSSAAGKPTSVTLSGPTAATVGQTVTVTASAAGATNPVYQFWYRQPFGTGGPGTGLGWHQSGGYGGASFSFTPTQPGGYEVVAYARSGSAPANETEAERIANETQSNVLAVVVTGSGSTTAATSASGQQPVRSPYIGGGQPSGVYSIGGHIVSSIPATYTGNVLDVSTGTTFYVLRGKFVGNLT